MNSLRWPQVAVASGVVVLGLIVVWQTFQVPVSPLYARVGPKVFPFAVSFGLIALGLALAFQAVTGRWTDEEQLQDEPVDWPSLAWLGLGLVLNLTLIGSLGFVIASTLMFVCVARAFGSRRPLFDAGIGVLTALVAYLGFDRVLGINIGGGILEGIL
jgi:putative tricarboxylic transport membrane protein